MVRSSTNRINKYGAKIDGDIIGQRYDATKDMAVAQQKEYFAKAAKLEKQVKLLIDGSPSMLQHFYIAFAEELGTKTTNNERSIVFTKWATRGLDAFLMNRIRFLVVGFNALRTFEPFIGYWKMNEGQGNDILDFSGNGVDGTNVGATWTADATRGNVLDFDGVDDYVEIPHNANQLGANLSNGFTISAWINPKSGGEDGGTESGRILDKSDGGAAGQNGFGLFLRASDDSLRFMINEGTKISSGDSSITYGEWQHVLVTISSGQLGNLYINGILTGTANQGLVQTIATITTTNAPRIGNRSGETDRTFDGEINQVLFFDRTLSSFDAGNLYDATKGFFL